MTFLQKISEWLDSRERSYAHGVRLFNSLATKTMQERYSAYFNQVSAAAPCDPHTTLLVSQLEKLRTMILHQPELFPDALTEQDEQPDFLNESEKNQEAEAIQQQIENLTDENIRLSDQIENLESADNDSTEAISDLYDKIEENNEQIRLLKKDVSMLMKPGIKVVTYSKMPEGIRRCYDRVREIVPLYASLHHDLSDEQTDEQRRKTAENLCRLDDERRRLWGIIDAWSEGNLTPEQAEGKQSEEDNPALRGMMLSRRLRRCRENLANSRRAAETWLAEGNEKSAQRALARVAKYEQELQALTDEIRKLEGREDIPSSEVSENHATTTTND